MEIGNTYLGASCQKKKLDEWAQNLATFKFPNGESYLDLSLRVSEFIKSIDLNNDNIVIVSHGGVIKTLFNIISKVDLSEVMSIKVSYGEVFQIQQDKISKVKV